MQHFVSHGHLLKPSQQRMSLFFRGGRAAITFVLDYNMTQRASNKCYMCIHAQANTAWKNVAVTCEATELQSMQIKFVTHGHLLIDSCRKCHILYSNSITTYHTAKTPTYHTANMKEYVITRHMAVELHSVCTIAQLASASIPDLQTALVFPFKKCQRYNKCLTW